MSTPFRLALPLVAAGAPVHGYYPLVAERLGARLVISDHAGVTNAIGAVAGVVMQAVTILVTAPKDEIFRLHAPDGTLDFHDPETAIAEARARSRALAVDAARRAGAADPHVETTIRRNSVERKGLSPLLVEATVVSTATGRPTAVTG
jgi:hypothetical protein